MYSLAILLSLFGTSLLFHVPFCCFLTCIQISQEAGKVVWYSHLFKNFSQFVVIHTVKGCEAEVDVFPEFPCFFDDSADVGNLISCSSAFSKASLYIWKFSVHILLKPSSKDFEHQPYIPWLKSNRCIILMQQFKSGIKQLWIMSRNQVSSVFLFHHSYFYP